MRKREGGMIEEEGRGEEEEGRNTEYGGMRGDVDMYEILC